MSERERCINECVMNESFRTHDWSRRWYGVASISRLLKITGLFGRIQSLLHVSFAKETYYLKEPTNRSHPIVD